MKRSVYAVASLIILLIAAFVFVLLPIFAGGQPHNNGIPAFGSFDGQQIRYEQGSDFANYVTRYADYFKQQNMEINESNYYYIFNSAFNNTVSSIAMTKAVEKTGYKVPSSLINRSLRPYFTDEKGEYSDKLYRLADPQRVSDMIVDLKKSLLIARYNEDCYGSNDTFGKRTLYGLKASEAEITFMNSLNALKRSFYLAVFNMDNYPDSEKASYANEHSEQFKKFDLSVITTTDKKEADEALSKIKSEELTFADAVTSYSEKHFSDNNGGLTNKYKYQIPEIFKNKEDADKVLALKVGELSNIVETSIGYSIFKMNAEPVALNTEDADALKTVYNYIRINSMGVIEDYFNKEATKFSQEAQAIDFKTACEKYNLEQLEIPLFPLNYANTAISATLNTAIDGLTGADKNENFLKTCFTLKKNEVSKPITNSHYLLVLQLNKEENDTPAAIDFASYTAGEPDPIKAATEGAEEKKENEGESSALAKAPSSEAGAKTSNNATNTADNATEEADKTPSIIDTITTKLQNFDNDSSQDALFKSPKLVNNMQDVYYKYIARND